MRQLILVLASLGVFLGFPCLARGSLEQSFDEQLDVTRWRCRAEMMEGAFQIGSQAESEFW